MYHIVKETFRQHGDPATAQGQMAYMKHQFEFFGLKMPAWTALAKKLHAEHGLPKGEDLKKLVRLCFADEHREMQYFALQTVELTLKHQVAEFIDFLEELVVTRSWWDTVDWLSKLIGKHFLRYPELTKPTTERWMDSGNMWLQRSSIIFQLMYREKTDAELLFAYVRRVSHSKAFFLQKAAGWALRQYAKTNPDAVDDFIAKTPLAPLTKREGSRRVPRVPPIP